MWWAVTTMSTAGSSLVPICGIGKLMGSLMLLLGTFFTALPIAIVGSYLTLTMESGRASRRARRVLFLRGGADMEFAEVVAKQKQSPGEAFLQHVHHRLHINEVSTSRPPADFLYLLDEYFTMGCGGCRQQQQGTTPQPPLRLVHEGGPCSMAPPYVALPHSVVEWSVGTRCDSLKDPDLVLPAINRGASQRLCVLCRHVASGRLHIRPACPTDVVHVNGQRVTADGVDLAVGDTITFAPTASPPCSYVVEMYNPV